MISGGLGLTVMQVQICGLPSPWFNPGFKWMHVMSNFSFPLSAEATLRFLFINIKVFHHSLHNQL